MRALIQRVSRASVHVGGDLVSEIGPGLLVLVGVREADTEARAGALADKIANMRIFADDEGRMNRSVLDAGGEVLVVSQFTLYGDTRKGRRPSFIEAAAPEAAETLVEVVAERLGALGVRTARGRFGAHMEVALTNDGPVTILVDT